ncbi:hypothetical protein ACOMHN_024138 [Nucella lapillus]
MDILMDIEREIGLSVLNNPGPKHDQGLTEEETNLLPTLTFTSQGQEAGDATPGGERGRVQCQICLLDLEDGDCLRSIPCRHHFHSRCLDEWLKRKATCPSCRHNLRPRRVDNQ